MWSRSLVGFIAGIIPLLVACAQSAPPPSAPAAGETPKYGGILRNVLDRDPGSCDQGGNQGGDRVSGNACGGLLNALLKWNTNDVLEPDLAERWESSSDGKTWTFYLRKDVKWHDGKPFIADDVVYNFQKWLKPPQGIRVGTPRVFQDYVDKVEKTDDFTVKFSMKFAPASFLTYVADHSTFIYPKHVLETLTPPSTPSLKSVVGTGPFKFKNEIRGSIYEMERNPSYFREGLPYLDGVRFTVLPDGASRLAALLTNQLDVYSGAEVPPEDAITLETGSQKDRIKIQSLYNLNYQYVAINMKAPPFTDRRVREAVLRVLNQREAIRILGEGRGIAGFRMFTDGKWSLPKEEIEKLPALGPPEQELAKAKELLAQAGYAGGITLDKPIYTRNVLRDENLGVWVTQQLAKIGIKAETKGIERALLQEVDDNHNYQIRAYYSTMALDDPDLGLKPFTCNDTGNNVQMCEQRYDQLYQEQTSTVDPSKRKALVQDMQRILRDQMAYASIFWVAFHVGQWDYVRGWDPRATNKWCYCMIVFDTAWLAK